MTALSVLDLLLDRDDVQQKLGTLGGVTHIVFAAYIEKSEAAERSAVNERITDRQ
ncbi:hypothetical protein [Pantoea sp. Tr-811]|uniref:hypothetical protein n=1 Tax=Pantoea sp. Tr-811 TaxID=2608361 RepID=UPI00142335D1|nr:hypothetical protein [Pantoea sp. Tr-811]